MKNEQAIFFLIILLGFCLGMVTGYITVGLNIERECQNSLTTYSEYIGRYCPLPSTLEPLYKELLPNGSLSDKTYFEEDLNEWIKNFTI